MGGRIDKSSVTAVTWHVMFGSYCDLYRGMSRKCCIQSLTVAFDICFESISNNTKHHINCQLPLQV